MAKNASLKVLVSYCLGDFCRAVFNGLTVTYLMYIFIPSAGSSVPILLPSAALVFAITRGFGTIFDAVIDPWIASRSDGSLSKRGARISFMRLAVIPWALSGVLMVFVPVGHAHWVNILWFVIMLFSFNFFSSLYLVPYAALAAELVTDTKKRVFFFTLSTLVFVIGSAVIYVTPMIKNAFIAAGLSELNAWRFSFVVFGFIALLFALAPVIFVKENEYVERKPCYVPLLKSFRETFRYKNFSILLVGYMIMWIAFSFFNYSLMYYVTMLLGAGEGFSTIVMAIAIAVGVASYPLVNLIAKKAGKKPMLIGASITYVLIYTAIFFYTLITPLIGGKVFGILIGVVIGFPISITNIIPNAAFADLAQYDEIKTGVNRAGMFFASRNFITQLSQSIVTFIIPLVVSAGSSSGNATVSGVRATALIAAGVIACSLVFYFLYDDGHITKTIDEYNRALRSEK
jgi:Na+/melibiose symporter and related transporters